METAFDIRSADGATVTATAFRDATGRAASAEAPVYVVLPAMGASASFYAPLARQLAAVGAAAVTVDLRGFGGSSERARRGARFDYGTVVDHDLPAAMREVRRRFEGRPIVLVAHSLGGQLATVAVATGRIRVDGLVLVAAGVAHWRAWQGRERAVFALSVLAVSTVARLLPWYPGRRLGFGGDQPRELMADWSRNALGGVYATRSSERPLEPEVPARGTPCLAVEVDGDLVAPAGAIDALLTRVDAREATRVVVPPVRGKGRWARHFAWVRAGETVVDEIAAWREATTARNRYHRPVADHPEAA